MSGAVHIPPRTPEEYNSPEVQEYLRRVRAYEASVKPHAEIVWRQYQRGLITFDEMTEGMTEVPSRAEKHTQMLADLKEAGWTTYPENVRVVQEQHARLLATRQGDGEQY